MKAYKTLQAHARKTQSLRLAALAADLHDTSKGHFDKVTKAIDTLIAKLKDEDKEDLEKRDECNEKYHKNQLNVNDLEWKIENNEATIKKLEQEITKAEDEKAATVKKIESTQKDISEMEDT